MYSRRLYWFKAMLLLSGQFAEILDVDRGVRFRLGPRGSIAMAAGMIMILGISLI